MKNIYRFIIVWAIVLSLVLSACATSGGSIGSSDPGADKTCQEGVCAEINVAQPIVLNQSTDVTITISSTVDKPGLSIKLQASPTNVTFGENTLWQYDAVANQSQVFSSTVMFTAPGEYLIAAGIFWNGSPLLVNQDRVVISDAGGTVNPTINANPTSDLFLPSTPQTESMTATAESDATLLPPPPIAGFSPQEWLEKCGWTIDQPETLSEWQNVSGWLNISETAIIDEQMNGTLSIGFKDDAKPDDIIQTRIGLCMMGEGWTTDSDHEWNTDLRSGIPYEVPVSLRFEETGDIPIFIVALDTQNNRIAGIGRLIYAKPREQSSDPLNESTITDISNSDDQAATMAVNPQWRTVTSESFSSTNWPSGSPLWLVKDTTTESPTDLDRRWGVRQTDLAAWPAAGGAAGLLSGNYPNSYSSEMILGPIDFRAASQAKVNFSMLLDTEQNYDFLDLYISSNGYGWYQKGSWSGTNGGWQTISVDLSGYTGFSTIYLEWRFRSDSSYAKTGVWVDNINVQLLPGTVTVSGTVTYTDRNGTAGRPAGYINIQVWEQDADSSWNFLEEKTADLNGYFQFDPRENWDDDPGDSDHRLDLYLLYETVFHKFQSNEHKVTKMDNSFYQWPIDGNTTRWNVTNGSFAGSKALPPGPDNRAKAIWLFEDIVHAFWTVPGDPGPARVRWQQGTTCAYVDKLVCSAFFVPGISPDGVFIPDAAQSVDAQDVVVHETAHEYMSNSNGFWYPIGAGLDSFWQCVLNPHSFFDSKTTACAYTEGWADFVAIAVNKSFDQNDNCFDWDANHCGGLSQNIETPNRGDGQLQGDTVEGRVAGSLWDLYDTANEGFDHSAVDWSSIWAIQRGTGAFNFRSFWNTWTAQSQTNGVYNKHNAVRSIYQNSIDYDNAPTSSPIGDVVVLQGLTRNNAVDLWNGGFNDSESARSEMTYSIVNTSSTCGASIDANHYVDIDLRSYPTYIGICNVTVRASDGIKTVNNVFREDIRRIVGRLYMPIIMSSPGGSGGAAAITSPFPSSEEQIIPTMSAYPAPMEGINGDSYLPPDSEMGNNPYPAPGQ